MAKTIIKNMNKLYIKNTEIGRGVFAGKNFQKGDIIEMSPVVIFEGDYESESEEVKIINGKAILIKTIIHEQLPPQVYNIIFDWSSLVLNDLHQNCIALLHGSLFNSKNPSNMEYSGNEEKMVIIFTAVRDILKDEELTINYSGGGGAHTSKENNWFTDKNIKYIP